MGKLQSKSGGYYLLECQVGAVTVQKALRFSDKSLDEVKALPSTDDFFLHIPDQPIKTDEE